jgi:hypothetical protein
VARRGKILRDPHVGPGLLMLEGRQHQFVLEGVWKSEVPPKPGLVVEVDLDSLGKVVGITAVPESQIAKEQAELALAAAKMKGAALASNMVAKFGVSQLVAAGLLILSWFSLTAISVQSPFLGKFDFTFWQVLGFLNADSLGQSLERHIDPSAGIYGFLALLAIAGPFVRYFWMDKRAVWAGLLPLVFMLGVGILIRANIQSSFGPPLDGRYGIQRQLQEEIMKAISLGFGAYTSILVSLYFAACSAKQFLETRVSQSPSVEKSQRAAA